MANYIYFFGFIARRKHSSC